MKKIKFAGITAVALLAVAPVATFATTANTAQAGLFDGTFTDPNAGKNANAAVVSTINSLTDQTYDENNPMPITSKFQGIAGLTESHLASSPVQFSSQIVNINSSMDDAATTALANSAGQKLKIYVSGNNVKADMQDAYKKGNGRSFTFTITVKNGENTVATKTLTYTNNTKTDADGGTTTKPTSALTEITGLNGYNVITLKGASSQVYPLISVLGKKSNRGLAGSTDWYTDKSGKDANGDTYYRVSTDEWVKAGSDTSLSSQDSI